MIIDFHTHILPGIDDGCTDERMSKEVLLKEIVQNVDCIVATPHYYCHEQSISSFIANRDNAYQKLMNSIKDIPDTPKIYLGAEVYYNNMLNHVDNLHDLCIQGTNYMLLELPYQKITKDIVDGVISLYENNCINIVLAHIERFLKFTSFKSLIPLLESDVICQINCGSLVNPVTRRNAYKMIKNSFIGAIGTDVHNTTTRAVCMEEGLNILKKKYSQEFIDEIMSTSCKILKNEDI